jgi:hypothetical protein
MQTLMHPFLQATVGGLMIGLASWLLLASLGRIAGISGIAGGVLVPVKGDTGWRLAFIIGLVLGGIATAATWQIPATALRPSGQLIAAGLLVGAGTVLGSGCTSGHGVCGLGRRSARSLAATLIFMGSAVLTVWLSKLWSGA